MMLVVLLRVSIVSNTRPMSYVRNIALIRLNMCMQSMCIDSTSAGIDLIILAQSQPYYPSLSWEIMNENAPG